MAIIMSLKAGCESQTKQASKQVLSRCQVGARYEWYYVAFGNWLVRFILIFHIYIF